MRKVFQFKIVAVAAACLLTVGNLFADDAQANEQFKLGIEAYSNKDYSGAASYFKAAQLYADDPLLKANALKESVKSYKAEGLLYNEFKSLEALLNGFPTNIDFAAAVDREFAIGDAFFAGQRDPAFPALSWVPWLKGDDHTQEVYEKALEHGPFAERAPEARLRLGRIYINQNKSKEALEALRLTVKMYPKTDPAKYAKLELINLLLQLSERGDGDSANANEALGMMKDFIKEYPEDSEIPWVKKTQRDVQNIIAERLYGYAKFYHRRENDRAAVRYLNDVIQEYPETDSVDHSEELLASIDDEYKVPEKKLERKPLPDLYKKEKMPIEPTKVLIIPENSGGKWLLPIEDYGLETPADVKPRQKD